MKKIYPVFFCFVLVGFLLAMTASASESGGTQKSIQNAKIAQEGNQQDNHQEEHAAGHSDPVAPVLLWVVIILVAAKIGGELFEKFKQPAVLGELLFGVLIGNLHLVGFTFFIPIADNAHIDILSRIGVIILLFMVGLESNIKEMMKVGLPSLLVAAVGVIAPFALGFLTSKFFLPEASGNTHIFIGAALTATSVGITARVFKDLGKLKIPEAKIILGAAVLDDIMGLIVLAVVTGIITTGSLSLASAGAITLKSMIFLIGAIVAGTYCAKWVGNRIARVHVDGTKIIAVLSAAFFFSWAADQIGLATIVGAFAAGLILDEVQFKGCCRKNHNGERVPEMGVEDLVRPIASFLVPIFFVMMGTQVKLETFMDPKVLGIAAALTVAAIIGKQVCSLAVNKSYNRLVVGLGMVPRGEVGLIFAIIGKELGVVNEALFSAIVIMVIITTLITPIAIKWAFDKAGTKQLSAA